MNRRVEELDQFKKMLRTVAENKVAHSVANDTIITSQEALIHELRVHQIELEMQNEELRQAHVALEETRDRYFDLYEFAPVGYLTLSSEAVIKEVNLTGAALFGDRARLLNHRFSSLVSLEDRDRWYRHFLYTLRHGGKQNCELTLVRGDKTTFDVFMNSVHIPDGQFPAVRIALTDITERKRMDEELRIAGIAFDSLEPMLVTDKEGVILRANNALTHMTGYSGNELVGRTMALFRSDHHGPSFYATIMETLKEKKKWKGEMWNRRKNGKVYAEWVSISAVSDTNGRPTHYVYFFSDITRNPECAAEIHRLAYYDALTQLPNRRLLLDRIEQAMAASTRTGNYGAILFLDLDHFKTINDTKGHELGDQLLVEVANRLHGILRERDTISRAGSTISRLGGDEFVILIENLSTNAPDSAIHATQVAEKVHECLTCPYELPSGKISCTTSLGMTLLYKRDLKVNILLKQADLALYQAKKAGGNTFRFFDPEMQAAVDRRIMQEADLCQSLERNQFKLFYQGLANVDQRIIGAEALLRWEHPEDGLKFPKDFIPLTEETGLILPLGRWVLDKACAQLKEWSMRSFSRHLSLSINVSGCHFHHPGFVPEVKSVLAQSGADPARLMFHLNESLAIKSRQKTISIMQDLKALGIGFALDGFGTGSSSLATLRDLPVDQLNIDGSLVRNVLGHRRDATIVSSLISMGSALGLTVNAQGVESEEQMTFLATKGCNNFQGYLINHPLSPDEFEKFLVFKNGPCSLSEIDPEN